ncbi:TrbC/VirB2 family protein [Ehrlichia sp. JZT12]
MIYNISKYLIGRMLLLLTLIIFCAVPNVGDTAPGSSAAPAGGKGYDTVTTVICNVVVFVQKLGLPIMTGVILGSSIMAIFGRLPWPAIVMLVVFTAIFFGAGKLITKFAGGINNLDADQFDCANISTNK